MKTTDPARRVRGADIGAADYSEGDTSYIAVVDKDRNMVSFEPSLHSGFGTGVVMGDLVFIFNCRGDYYSLTPGEPRSLEPGKRPRSTLQSTLVMKDGQPWMITGSPGGDDQIHRTVQTLLNLVDFGMNVQQAIEAPRWSTRSFASSVFPHRMSDPGNLSVESRVPETVHKPWRRRGTSCRPRERGRWARMQRSWWIRGPVCSAPAPIRASKRTRGPAARQQSRIVIHPSADAPSPTAR